MDRITRHIAEFATMLDFADLPDGIVHAATQRLIDSLGCALGAHDCGPANIGRRLAEGQVAGKYPGRVLFANQVLPAESATFINSTMIRNFDFNDRWPGGHPSDCLGAHLALAGAMPVDGKRLLTAMAVTYEIFARMSESSQLRRDGWDQGYAIGISTAAGISNLLGLPVETAAHAVKIIATANLPLRVTRSGELTAWKNAATSYAAKNGLFASLLAAEGMEGPAKPFEGRAGLWEKVTGPFELRPFPTEGGESLIPQVLLKYWPLETNGQPVVWAALEAREKVRPEDIAAIEFFTDQFTRHEIGSEPEKWDPQTRETADHSLPYIFARALVDGPITVASFADDAVRDPALRPLMEKITVTVDDEFEAMLPQMVIRVKITLRDGGTQSIEIANPLGHPDNPMQDDDIEKKFLSLGEPVIGEARCRAFLDAWWDVRKAGDVRPLIALADI